MKHIGMFLFFTLMISFYGLKAQQNVAVTAIFQKNICQTYHNEGNSTVKIEFQMSGLTAESTQTFSNKALKNDKVVNCIVASTTKQGLRAGKMELAAQADFDYIKNVFIEAGVAFVHVEDLILPIENWKSFNNEQCTEIVKMNKYINDLETKRIWILNNPEEKAKAEQNGWFTQNNEFLEKAIKAKKEFVQSIN